jgi:glutathione S-transferase
MIQLVGRNLSPFVRRVAVALNLLGIAYEQLPLSTVADRDAIRAFNPLTRVPVLRLEDGRSLIDSSAILAYLDTRPEARERPLMPTDPSQRLAAHQLSALALGVAEKSVAAFYEATRRPADKIYDAWLHECEAQCLGGLEALEAAARAGWFVSDQPSVADITVYVAVQNVGAVNSGVLQARALPRLEAFMARCADVTAFESVAAA